MKKILLLVSMVCLSFNPIIQKFNTTYNRSLQFKEASCSTDTFMLYSAKVSVDSISFQSSHITTKEKMDLTYRYELR